MTNDKIQQFLFFINNDKRLTYPQKVRRDRLIAQNYTADSSKKTSPPIKQKHYPKAAVKFLYQFSSSEHLKWLTHAPDKNPDFDYDNYVKSARKYVRANSRELNSFTRDNILDFIGKEGGRGFKDYQDNVLNYSWSCPDVKAWCASHPNQHPYEAIIGDHEFSWYINAFKHAIEFRTDNINYTFSKLVRKFFRMKCPDFHLSFTENFTSVGQALKTFFDVRQFFLALEQICKWLDENKTKSIDLELDLINDTESDYFEFVIFHKGSYYTYDKTKSKGLSGDLEKTRRYLFNVADWRIETDCNNHSSISMDCLSEGHKMYKNSQNGYSMYTPIAVSGCPNVGGLKYIFKLYKNE